MLFSDQKNSKLFYCKLPLGIFRMSLNSGDDSTVLATSKKCRDGVKLKGFWKPRESSSILNSISIALNICSFSFKPRSEPKAWLRCSSKSFSRKTSYLAKLGRGDASILIRFPGEWQWITAKIVLNSRTLCSHMFTIFLIVIAKNITSRLITLRNSLMTIRHTFAIQRVISSYLMIYGRQAIRTLFRFPESAMWKIVCLSK